MANTPIKPACLDRVAAAQYVSLSVITMERMVAKNEFPAPRQLGGRRVGWLLRELDAWCEARPVSSNLPPENCGGRRNRELDLTASYALAKQVPDLAERGCTISTAYGDLNIPPGSLATRLAKLLEAEIRKGGDRLGDTTTGRA